MSVIRIKANALSGTSKFGVEGCNLESGSLAGNKHDLIGISVEPNAY